MKRSLKSILLVILLLSLSCAAMLTGAAADEAEFPDAMEKILADGDILAARQGEPIRLSTDGHIGIPVEISLFYSGNTPAVAGNGLDSTPVVMYILNTRTTRIGTKSDTEIIGSMLDRGYAVAVVDYLGDPRAISPELDLSAHRLSSRLSGGEFFGTELLPKGVYRNLYTVPAGYDLSINNVFWEIDKHSTDGTLEKIVNIWNNDFRSWHAEVVIKWTDESGNRKSTQTAHDGTDPVWLSADGAPDESGEYIRVKHTLPLTVSDCVRPDGSPIDLNLYAFVIYPTGNVEVPVMINSSSSGQLAYGVIKRDQPYLLTAMLNGYAGAAFDHGFVPMARDDHYGYFDGSTPESGSVTGDNNTYSIHFYNNTLIDTAAMRFFRYLSLSDADIELQLDAFGVYGNSKGGWMTALGEVDPTVLPMRRLFIGHHGETRYDNGKTTAEGIIDGGEKQPWLEYGGEPIDSGADLIYASCGGVSEAITEGHAPTFITCNMQDYLSSYYSSSNELVNICRTMNVPSMWFEANIGHALGYGKDYHYGVDIYDAFFDFAGYWLRGDAVKVVYITSERDYAGLPTHSPITLKFSGSVTEAEISRITLTHSGGSAGGFWTSAFGGTEWTLHPTGMLGGTEYTLTVPADLTGENGVQMGEAVTYTFSTGYEYADGFTTVRGERGTYLYYTMPESKPTLEGKLDKYLLRLLVANDASNTAEIYTLGSFNGADPDASALGSLVGSINLSGSGYAELDLTDLISPLSPGDSIALLVKPKHTVGEHTVCNISGRDALWSKIAYANSMDWSIATAPTGEDALMLSTTPLNTHYTDDHFHNGLINTALLANYYVTGMKSKLLSDADVGRKFTVTFRVYDTVSRYLAVNMKGCTSEKTETVDYNRDYLNVLTKANEWVTVSLTYVVDEPSEFGSLGCFEQAMTVRGYAFGDTEAPIYFTDFITTETVSDIELSAAELVYTTTEQKENPLSTPYGEIPDRYADAEEYPFAVFKRTENGYEFTAAIADAFADNEPAVTAHLSGSAVILMRRDFTLAGHFNNLGRYADLTFDLGGYTLNNGGYILVYNTISAYDVKVHFKNGSIVNTSASTPIFRFGKSKATVCKNASLTLEGVTLKNASESNSTYIYTYHNFKDSVAIDIRLDGCTLDLGTPEAQTVFTLGKASAPTTLTVTGGRIISPSMSGLTLVKPVEASSTALFKKGEGGYTTLHVPVGSTPKDITVDTDEGKLKFECKSSTADGDIYELFSYEPFNPTTPYGEIGAEYASAVDYPFVVFAADGRFVGGYPALFAKTAGDFDLSIIAMHAAREAGDGSVILMRRDTEYTDAVAYPNIANNVGTVTLDLGGFTLHDKHTYGGGLFALVAKASPTESKLIVKNGELLAYTSPLVSFGEARATLTGIRLSIEFDGVRIGYGNGSTAKQLIHSVANPTLDITYALTLSNCRIDGVTNAPTGSTLFAEGSKEGSLTVTVTDCEINDPNNPKTEIKPQYSASFADGFIINIYIPVCDGITSVSLGKNEYTDLGALTVRKLDGVDHYHLTLSVLPTDALDGVTLAVRVAESSDYIGGNWELSLIGYLSEIATDPTASALAMASLSYVRAAYLFAEADTATLEAVNSAVEAVIGKDFDAQNPPKPIEHTASTDGLDSACLILSHTPTVMFFPARDQSGRPIYSAESFSFTAGGVTLTPVITESPDGRAAICVTVPAHLLSEVIEYTVEGTDIHGEYSLSDYLSFTEEYGDPSLTHLITRMMKYAEAVKEYKANNP